MQPPSKAQKISENAKVKPHHAEEALKRNNSSKRPNSFLVESETNARSFHSSHSSSVKDTKTKYGSDEKFIQGVETAVQSQKEGGTHGKGVRHNKDKVLDENRPRLLPQAERSPSNGPAKMVNWKGTFKVLNIEAMAINIEPKASICRTCERFLAHHPEKVSRKAYAFSKQIGEVLQFNLHPRRDFWPETFELERPTWNDIAFYFYPEKSERSKKQYSVLLMLIEKNDFVLRSCIGHVELLVYPSTLFPADFQRLGGSLFMWGVYQVLQDNGTTSKADDTGTRCDAKEGQNRRSEAWRNAQKEREASAL